TSGQPERAAEHYRELLQSGSAEPELLDRIEQAAQATHQGEILREVYERRIATSPERFERAEWLRRLGDVYAAKLADQDAAVASWKRAARLCDEAPADPQRAIRLYERVSSAAPDDTEAAERLLALCGGAGDWVKLPSVYVTLLRNTTDER